MSQSDRNAGPGVTDKTSSSSTDAPGADANGSEVSARKPLRGAYDPAPARASAPNGASNGSSSNGSARKTSARKPAARKPSRGGLSAEDYARTTQDAADSTAVIPVVEDEESKATPPTAPPPAPKPAGRKPRRPKTSAAEGTQKAALVPDDAPTAKQPAVVPETKTKTEAASPAIVASHVSRRLSYVDPWSVTRLAFVVSVALMIVAVVAAVVFWLVLAVTGVWDNINDSVKNVLSDDSGGFNIGDYLGFWRLLGFALISSALNVVFMTALATICAHLYNLAAQIMGGFKVNFTDEK